MRAEKDFEDLLKALNNNKVNYCIVGAYAVMYYTRPRFTNDMDVLIQATPENANRTIKAIEDFGFVGTGAKPDDLLDREKIFELGQPPIMVHITTKIDGLSDDEIWNNLEKGKYGLTPVYYLGIEQLKKNKEAMLKKESRKETVDKNDLDALLKVKNKKRGFGRTT